MGRPAFGVPLVGNDFAVMPARPLVRQIRIPVLKPALPDGPDIDDSVLQSIDIENVVQLPQTFPARAKFKFFGFVRWLVVGLMLLVLATSGWMLIHPEKANPASTHAVAAAGITSAPVSMAEDISKQKITFVINGQTITPTSIDINNWLGRDLTASPDNQLVANQDAIKNYFASISGPYTKEVKNKILAADGSILSPGQDGQKLDTAAALTSISNNLLSGKGMNFNLAVVPVVAKTLSINDIEKIMVANITSKTMVAYENGKPVKNFLISAGVASSPTPTGQFTITRKFVTDEMSGTNPNGSHYDIKAVKYVSYFDDSIGAAIHANDWAPQTIFGHVNESLGCLAMTVTDSKWVYDWAPVGTILINQK